MQRPSRPCKYPRCPHLAVKDGYCELHYKQIQRQTDQKRGTSTERGYNYQWRKIRAYVLNREPLCRECANEGRVTPAVAVHHIDGNVHNMSLDNLEPICQSCHSKITAKEQGFAAHTD